jgi:ATP-dependent Lon protease
VRRNTAMTGKISLTGRVLPNGGLREKSMAAYRCGIARVLIPRENESDLWEIDPAVKAQVEFLPVDRLEDVFRLALLPEEAAKKEAPRAPISAVQGKPNRKSIAQ